MSAHGLLEYSSDDGSFVEQVGSFTIGVVVVVVGCSVVVTTVGSREHFVNIIYLFYVQRMGCTEITFQKKTGKDTCTTYTL